MKWIKSGKEILWSQRSLVVVGGWKKLMTMQWPSWMLKKIKWF